MVTSVADEVAALKQQLDELQAEVLRLSRETVRPRPAASPANAKRVDTRSIVSRRRLIGAAAGLAGGTLAALRAAPASATQGQAVVAGQTNTASGTTAVRTTGFAGLFGRSESTSGRGVSALASAYRGSTYGVHAEARSSNGTGVLGLARARRGLAVGVAGVSGGDRGVGVRGVAGSGTGMTYGVTGESGSTSGRGVRGWASAYSGHTYGVYGRSDSTSGIGVRGVATNSSGTTFGVLGAARSADGFALFGQGRMMVTGRSYLAAPDSPPANDELPSGSISIYLDEITDHLKVRVKRADGTLRTASVELF